MSKSAFRIHLWYLAKTWVTFLLVENLNNFRTGINSRHNWHSLKDLSWCTIKLVRKFNKVVTKWIIFIFYHIWCVARLEYNFKKVTKYSWRNVTFSKVAGFSPICTIWCYLCNLKNVKNTHEEVLFLVKLQALLSLQGKPSLQANSIINVFFRNFQSFPYSCFNLISYAADTLHL